MSIYATTADFMPNRRDIRNADIMPNRKDIRSTAYITCYMKLPAFQNRKEKGE